MADSERGNGMSYEEARAQAERYVARFGGTVDGAPEHVIVRAERFTARMDWGSGQWVVVRQDPGSPDPVALLAVHGREETREERLLREQDAAVATLTRANGAAWVEANGPFLTNSTPCASCGGPNVAHGVMFAERFCSCQLLSGGKCGCLKFVPDHGPVKAALAARAARARPSPEVVFANGFLGALAGGVR